MRIAILEFETHSHLLLLWEELLKDLKEVEYTFFLSSFINRQVPEIPSAKKEILKVEEIYNYTEEFKNFDVVILNTLHRNFEKFNSVFAHCKVLLLVHNCNFYFHSISPQWKDISKVKNISLIYYYLKIILKEKIYQTKNIVNKARGYGFLNSEIAMKNQVAGKLNFVIPLLYNSFFSRVENSTEIRIVIPGNVSCNRRDYSLIFKTLITIQPKEKLRVIFLGKPDGQKMSKELEKLKKSVHPHIQIDYYTQRIPQDDFTAQIKSAHFVLCPVLKETQFYLQPEIYGKTKASGNEADCIYYGKVGIFPDYYTVPNWMCIYYKNKDNLSDILENLTYEKYNEYHQELSAQIEYFTQKNSQKQLLTLLKTMQNS